MSLRKLVFFGALVMGLIAGATFVGITVPSAAAHVLESTPSEELVYRMRHQGLKRPISLEGRADLGSLFLSAASEIDKLDLGCRFVTSFEIRFRETGMEWIAGYEIDVECEEAPEPALGLFFDVNHRMIGTLGLAQ